MKHLLVTAGPTREKIDPVRFLSNYSTGQFGYEIAGEAKQRGWRVILVSGPTHLKPPKGVRFIRVESALEMMKVVKREFKNADCLIMAAAVSDWRPRFPSIRKLKRKGSARTLELAENPGILETVSKGKGHRITVGFALETENLARNAYNKLRDKKLDLIIANRLGQKSSAFGNSIIDILMIDKAGKRTVLRRKSKRKLAKIILDRVSNINI